MKISFDKSILLLKCFITICFHCVKLGNNIVYYSCERIDFKEVRFRDV